MAYVNIPPNFQDMFSSITDRIIKLETGPKNISEPINIVGSAATGSLNIDIITAGIWYYNVNSTNNFTLNIRGSSDVKLNDYMNTGTSLTTVILNQNGSTAYRPTAYSVDGASITPKWYPSAPTAGVANATDAYTLTIVKTADATFTMFATLVSFV